MEHCVVVSGAHEILAGRHCLVTLAYCDSASRCGAYHPSHSRMRAGTLVPQVQYAPTHVPTGSRCSLRPITATPFLVDQADHSLQYLKPIHPPLLFIVRLCNRRRSTRIQRPSIKPPKQVRTARGAWPTSHHNASRVKRRRDSVGAVPVLHCQFAFWLRCRLPMSVCLLWAEWVLEGKQATRTVW